MAENKTGITGQSVEEYIEALPTPNRIKEAKQLHTLFQEVTGENGHMWGPSIIGYGQYHYIYDSGREGDFMTAGFSPRKSAISLYVMGGISRFETLIDQLGRIKKGKGGCVYIKHLEDINLDVLRQLILVSYEYIGNKKWP